MSEAKKLDGGKLPMHLVPPEVTEALALILGPGAKKYGERNWEQGGLTWDRLYAAAQRHLQEAHKFVSTGGKYGEWIDQDTGQPHIYCALAELTFIVTYERRGMLNQPKPKDPRKPGFYRRTLEEIRERGCYGFYLPPYVATMAEVPFCGNVEAYYEEVK